MLIVKYTPKNSKTRYFFNKDVIIATYGYAISCHKAQGQEWDNVYIDAGWLMPVWDAAKWFYTAITRAKCKVEVTQNKYLKIN
jgi:exodeoxyribonuclease-5